MTTTATAASTASSTGTVRVFRVFIRATPQAIWDAITDPAWNDKYGYSARNEYDLRAGGAFRVFANPTMLEFGAPEVVIDGQVVEVDPPHRLVQTWRSLFDPETVAEGFTRVTWQIEDDAPSGATRVSVTHELEGAPVTATQVAGDNPNAGGGWSFILSDLKTLLETGKTLSG